MSKHKRRSSGALGLNLSAAENLIDERKSRPPAGLPRARRFRLPAILVLLLAGLGIMASWLTGSGPGAIATGFSPARALNTIGLSRLNPFAAPPPSPTPQLSKEYIYAKSQLLAVADANAAVSTATDIAVWRPLTGAWYMLGENGEPQQLAVFGRQGDIPVQGDYDGDGLTDFSFFRPSDAQTYVLRSSDKADYWVELGTQSDIPAPADFDGDGKTDIVLWTPATQVWNIRLSSTDADITPTYGSSAGIPVSGDFDGDGLADRAYWHNQSHTFHSVNSSDGAVRSESDVGSTGNLPVCADYDGDGKTDFAVLAGNKWKILGSSTGTITNTTWQSAGDTPVPNDYDGDGKVDIAVWHLASPTAYWYIRQSSDLSTRTEMLGILGDVPVPAIYRR